MKVLLVSHGSIAQGFCDTAKKFFGAEDIYYANVDLETGTKGLIEKVNAFLDEWKNEPVVVCSDLKGGSANQTMMQYIDRPNVYLISGVNLSLILQLVLVPEITNDSLVEMIEAAKNDLVLVNESISNVFDEDDE